MNPILYRASSIALPVFVCAISASSASWADTSAGSDPFVAQRNAVHAAHQAYKKEVAAAQHDFDRVEEAADREYKKAVAKAKAERNKDIAAIKAKD